MLLILFLTCFNTIITFGKFAMKISIISASHRMNQSKKICDFLKNETY